MALTETKCKATKAADKVYRVADEKGLCLEVRPNGAKLWRYRYRLDNKANMFSLGAYPAVTLEEARQERRRCRELVKIGIHPSHDKRAKAAAERESRANTFRAVSEDWLAENRKRWTDYYFKQADRALKRHLYPSLGDLPIKQVTAPLLRDALKTTAATAPTVAILLRQWVSAIFRYAVLHDLAEHDPAGALKSLINRPKVRHNPPLAQNELPQFMAKLDAYGGYATTKIAIGLLAYVFVRTVELRKSEWVEIDFDSAIWRIPGSRMKMGSDHIVPLSTQAIELLRQLQTMTGNRKYLFPNYRNPQDCMTGTTINRALERMGYGGRFSGHGFRSTASTILNEQGYNPDWIETQLAHVPRNKVRASYNHARYLTERRQMMQEWADLLDQLAAGGNVVVGKFGTA